MLQKIAKKKLKAILQKMKISALYDKNNLKISAFYEV